jgi:HEPN domain-containing protein
MLARLNELYIDSRYPAEFGLLPYGKPTVENAKRFCDFARRTYERTTNIIEG